MGNIIDYIFYRIYSSYKSKESSPKYNAILYIATSFAFLLSPFWVLFMQVGGLNDSKYYYLYFFGYIAIIFSLVTYKYCGDEILTDLRDRYIDCWANRKISTFFCFLTMPICIAIGMGGMQIVLNIIEHNHLYGIGYKGIMEKLCY